MLDILPSLHVRLLHTVLLHALHTHAVWVAKLLRFTCNVLHSHATDALGLRDRAIFVGEEQSLQSDDLLPQLRYSSGKSVVL